jgi:hypothetical protein
MHGKDKSFLTLVLSVHLLVARFPKADLGTRPYAPDFLHRHIILDELELDNT